MDGELVDWADATVHVLTHTMHYGSGVFEGIRAYPTSRGVAVFRLGDHIRRLFASAKIFMIDIPYTVEEIIEATRAGGAGQRPARRLLPATARLPGLRRDGPQPAALPGQRLGRRLALGHLPGRRGRGQRGLGARSARGGVTTPTPSRRRPRAPACT